MILKYQNNDTWGFIDSVRQAANKDIDYGAMVRKYDEHYKSMPCEAGHQDPAEYMDGKRLSEDVVTANKVFSAACMDTADEGINRHAENLLEETAIQNNWPACAILLYLEDCKEYDAILLVTNQKAFLMNDKGQTIERLC